MTPPIVLVHGLFGHLRDPVILRAFDNVEVYTPDLLGYGLNASIDTNGITLHDQAEHLLSELDANGLTRIHLVGHSVGGAVAVLAAARQSDRIVSVTSVEGNFVPADAFWSAELAQKPDHEVETMLADLRLDPQAWIEQAEVSRSPWSADLAAAWLNH